MNCENQLGVKNRARSQKGGRAQSKGGHRGVEWHGWECSEPNFAGCDGNLSQIRVGLRFGLRFTREQAIVNSMEER